MHIYNYLLGDIFTCRVMSIYPMSAYLCREALLQQGSELSVARGEGQRTHLVSIGNDVVDLLLQHSATGQKTTNINDKSSVIVQRLDNFWDNSWPCHLYCLCE